MDLHLVDSNADVVEAWLQAFSGLPEVNVSCGDILGLAHCCVVSPANSFGFMDGGFDRALVSHFGVSLQQRVTEMVARRAEGHLPVGASEIVQTQNERIPYLLCAPTMVTPGAVEASNCYRAMRAVLRVAEENSEVITDVYCPGLGTGVGQVDVGEAAVAMQKAYSDWKAS